MLIIDEAQNLPLPVLEQIRILSNLETDKEKLLQIILVGQLEPADAAAIAGDAPARSAGVDSLSSSSRSMLRPVAAYVAHRLAIAGGNEAAVTFAPKALQQVHRWSGGIPRLINLICDRALLAAFSIRANRITAEMVAHAAENLDVPAPPPAAFGLASDARRRSSPPPPWCCCRRPLPSAPRRMSTSVWRRPGRSHGQRRAVGPIPAAPVTPAAAVREPSRPPDRELPAEAGVHDSGRARFLTGWRAPRRTSPRRPNGSRRPVSACSMRRCTSDRAGAGSACWPGLRRFAVGEAGHGADQSRGARERCASGERRLCDWACGCGAARTLILGSIHRARSREPHSQRACRRSVDARDTEEPSHVRAAAESLPGRAAAEPSPGRVAGEPSAGRARADTVPACSDTRLRRRAASRSTAWSATASRH